MDDEVAGGEGPCSAPPAAAPHRIEIRWYPVGIALLKVRTAGRASGGTRGCRFLVDRVIYSRQLAISVCMMAWAPIASSCSMIWMTFLRSTIARTEHQASSSSLLTVGEL